MRGGIATPICGRDLIRTEANREAWHLGRVPVAFAISL
jgi:hypothetical protein